MFRVGIVTTLDPQNCRVRVAFPDRDQIRSWWLQVIVPKAQNDKAYWLPDVGEQVVCLMDEYDEDGAVVGAIYSTQDTTPVQNADVFHLSFKDGAAFEYNRTVHSLSVSVPSGGTVVITSGGASITIDSSGNVKVVAAGQVELGSGALKGVARLGDSVSCPAGIGTIVSASATVVAAG